MKKLLYGAAEANPRESLTKLQLLGFRPSYWGFSHSANVNAWVCLSVGAGRYALSQHPDAVFVVHDEFLNCYALTTEFVDGTVTFLKPGGLPQFVPGANWGIIGQPVTLGEPLNHRQRLLTDYAENSFFSPLQSAVYKLPKDMQLPVKNQIISSLMNGHSRERLTQYVMLLVRGDTDGDRKSRARLEKILDFVYSDKHSMVAALPEVRSYYTPGIGKDEDLFESVPWKDMEERYEIDAFELRYSMKTYCNIATGVRDSGVDVQFFEGQARRRAGQND
jgi:hypothetical protein